MTNAAPTPPAANPYDLVPYDTTPFPYTQPSRLAAIGRLFGMSPADVRGARVLELGCARGDNLLPLAARFPAARFVGVDYSSVQVAAAEATKAEIGAGNVEFLCRSIADIGPELGRFDYVICHGVLSWVPEPVRDAIFRVCAENLAPDGVAMVSYNTLPGWHQVRAARDMMLFHTARFADPREKVAQAKALLRFVRDGARADLVAYREALTAELAILESNPDSYILHDHLEAENQPFHFHEVVARASARGLAYLGDSNIESMFIGNFPPDVAAMLATADDIVRQEQYADFLTNRRFRISLFCGADRRLTRNIDAARIFDFDIESSFLPADAAAIDLAVDAPAHFKSVNGTEVTTATRYSAAAMLELAGLGARTVRADDVVARALARLGPAAPEGAEQAVRAGLLELGMMLVMRGALRLHSVPSDIPETPPARPRAFAPVAAAARAGRARVWSRMQNSVVLGPAELALMSACDGTADMAALADAMLARIADGTLDMKVDGAKVVDPAAARPGIEAWVRECVVRFNAAGLFA